MEWAQILVIILAVFLAIFLLLGIVLLVVLIKLSRQIRNMAASAERTVAGFERAAGNISRLASPVTLLSGASQIIRRIRGKK